MQNVFIYAHTFSHFVFICIGLCLYQLHACIRVYFAYILGLSAYITSWFILKFYHHRLSRRHHHHNYHRRRRHRHHHQPGNYT